MAKWQRFNYPSCNPLGADGRRLTAGPAHIDISRRAALEGMVLLKNEGGALPLARGAKAALFGKGTFDYVKGGGGSGDVTVPYTHNLYDGMKAHADRVATFEPLNDFYRASVQAQYAAGRAPGMVDEPELPDDLLRRAAAFADVAVVSISRFSGEGWDRKCAFDRIEKHRGIWGDDSAQSALVFPKGDFVLTDGEAAMVEKVCAAFETVVVVLNVGSVFDTGWFRDNPAISAVLLGWQAGMEGGLAEAELLLGLANPSGKLADTFAATLEDYPSSPGFYESDDYVEYTEDIYVGYRYFETLPGAAEKVNYPFGFGLSYTTFLLYHFEARQDGEEIAVRGSVVNTGEVPGREVVQVYFSAPQGRLGKPARQLAAFRKTRLLQPGEAQRVELRFPLRDMASYDDLGKVQKSAWVLEAGTYRFFVGTDVRSARSVGFELTLDANRVVEQLSPRMVPNRLEKRLLADGSYEALPQGEAEDPNASALPRDDLSEHGWLKTPDVRAEAGRNFFLPGEERRLSEVAEGALDLDAFLAQLTDEDLAWLLGGQPNTGVANTFGYGNNARFGIPSAMTADGPAGLRIQPEAGVVTTAFPCACLLACTWDPEVTEAVGAAAGAEVKENNVGVWLAPAINIHRNPLCGRNFEYYSEDPLLTGQLAGAMIRGVQSNGVAATAKHFALNNKETNRLDSDSRCSERAIREIYLRAFRIVAQEYGVWSIMTSYNIINGRRASENADLLNGILRDEWGWEGMVTTDWWTHGEHYKECAAGNDVKMGCGYPDRLLAALEKGVLTRAQMERAAKHILGLLLKLD